MAVQIIILYGIPKKLAAVASLAVSAVCCKDRSHPICYLLGYHCMYSIDMAAGIPAGDMYNCTTVVPSADRTAVSQHS